MFVSYSGKHVSKAGIIATSISDYTIFRCIETEIIPGKSDDTIKFKINKNNVYLRILIEEIL